MPITIADVVFSDVGATNYVEAIVVGLTSGSTSIVVGACGRACGAYAGFSLRRELFNPADVTTVLALVRKLLLSPTDFVYYLRAFPPPHPPGRFGFDPAARDALRPLPLTDRLRTRMSVLIVPLVTSAGLLQSVLDHLLYSREIIPARMAN